VVVGIASGVVAAVDDRAFPTGGSEAFGGDEACEAGADDQEIGGGVWLHGRVGLEKARCRPWSIFRFLEKNHT
jgi:hypothetical protein